MDWSWLGNAFNIMFGAVVGIAGTVIYDRRFAKRPDLRYVFGAPARFGTTIYQNLGVTNAGRETTTDVRMNFSRTKFDSSEYQVSYDGKYDIEKTDDQVGMLIPSFPPEDSVTVSFTFSPPKSSIAKIQELFLSAKSKECVAKPLERTRADRPYLIAIGALAGVLLGILSVAFWELKSAQQITPLARSTEGRAVFFEIHNDLGAENRLLRGMIISGANLGRGPGKGRIVFTYRNDITGEGVKSEPMEIDAPSIKAWKSHWIEFAFSNSMQERFNSVLKELSRKLPEGNSWGVETQIITDSGEVISTSQWPTERPKQK
jgi:hypothetical protein